jgi:hypothetical protein
MERPKTLREVKKFLNKVDEKFLDRKFVIQQEEELHYVHFLDLSADDLYFNSENPEDGCMTLLDWEEYRPEVNPKNLKLGIPKGSPILTEDFPFNINQFKQTEMDKVKAKFSCNSVEEFQTSKEAKLTAIYGTEGENADFTNSTPSGNIVINIDKSASASNFFIPGQDYYLEFSKAQMPLKTS